METTLVRLLKELVSHPDDIAIEKEELQSGLVYLHIKANEEDKALIIGKGGRTIKAIQDIIVVKAVKENKKVILKVD